MLAITCYTDVSYKKFQQIVREKDSMARSNIQAIVLAAGASTRFKSETPKLLYTLCGQEMILYPLKTLQQLAIPTTLVIGHKKELIKRILEQHSFDSLSYSEQKQQLGTGDAVASTAVSWYADNILVLNGDMPLIQAATVQELIAQHAASDATVSFVITHNNDPVSSAGYGRVVQRDNQIAIVEARHFTGDHAVDCFVNAGIYLFKRDFLKRFIGSLSKHTGSQEIYLTDLIEIASKQGLGVATVIVPFDQVRGVNTLKELWAAEQIKRAEIIEHWMQQGVRFVYAQSAHVDCDVMIGSGTSIGAGVQLLSGTRIGRQCSIGSFSCIKNTIIADHVTVHSHVVISDATLAEMSSVGPFAHIHNNSVIGSEAVIGNFVEVTKSSVAQKTRIKHLSYIGNAHIGAEVNIGAGTVICNYNGVTKNTTIIEDKAFIGSNNSLIAPVTIGHDAMTAAGSVIKEDVPAHALAIARAQQVNKEGYAKRLRESVPVVAAVKSRS